MSHRSQPAFLPLALCALLASALVACEPAERAPVTSTEWKEIALGGDTICARGTPYSFFISEGRSDKVIIDFMGGGACWTQESCGLGAGQLFDDSVDSLRERVEDGFPGVYDRTREDNPFKDWTHVVLPYCTGDIHWGDNVVDYSDTLTIHHKGAVNSRAVLDWVFEHYKKPERVLVTGCSAGSYGSIYWSPHVLRQYPNAYVVQMGDSGAGVVTDSFFQESFPKWNAIAAAPDWIPNLDPSKIDYMTLALPDLYSRLGAFYPTNTFAQFNTRLDETQTVFFSAMGGTGGAPEWSKRMLQSIATIHETTANFRSYTDPGDFHCVLPDDNFHKVEVGGVKWTDWMLGLMNGSPVDDVACDECAL